MAESFEDPSKKRRLDEDGTASAFAQSPADGRKEKLERWLKPLNNEQLVKLLVDMYVEIPSLDQSTVTFLPQLLDRPWAVLPTLTCMYISSCLLSFLSDVENNLAWRVEPPLLLHLAVHGFASLKPLSCVFGVRSNFSSFL